MIFPLVRANGRKSIIPEGSIFFAFLVIVICDATEQTIGVSRRSGAAQLELHAFQDLPCQEEPSTACRWRI